MRPSMRLFAAVLLVFLLAFATENGARVGEARQCETASHKFHGICTSGRNCESVCATEGFPGGHCEGFRRRCMCTRPCADD